MSDEPRWPTSWHDASPAFAPRAPSPLFPRIDAEREDALVAKWIPPEAGAAAAPAKTEAPKPAQITYDDFMRAELRVAQIVTAQAVPKAKKLLQLTVDVGEGRHRTVVAGIAEAYEPAALVGRKVILVANLAPATIRGIQSEGMILAAGDDQILGLAAVDPDAPVGTRVR